MKGQGRVELVILVEANPDGRREGGSTVPMNWYS